MWRNAPGPVCASILRTPAAEHPDDYWDQVIEVNLKGYFLISQRAARMMTAHGGGSIINISSIAGLSPLLGQLP